MSRPLFSVIIANYNYGRFLEEAVQSVIAQNMGDQVELIICDAASTDNSVEIIKKYANGLPPNTPLATNHQSLTTNITWWCSEKDKGQSHAFNKGFSHSRGKFLTWLNADDLYVKGALVKIVYELKKYPDCEWFTGNTYRFTQDDGVVQIWWGPHYLPLCLQTENSPIAVYGPSAFFSRRVYERVGGIREDMYYMMDIDLWARMMKAGVKQRRINCFCWAFRLHQESKTAEYGDHKLVPTSRAAFEVERRDFFARTGYRESRTVQFLIRIWRILDGSMIRGCWLKRKCK